MPVCSRCGVEKSLDAFYPARNQRGRRSECKPCKNAMRKTEYRHSRERELKVSEAWYNANEKRMKAWAAEYSRRPEVKETRNRKRRERRRIHGRGKTCPPTPNMRIRKLLSGRIWAALKGIAKTDHTMSLVGCSIEQFKAHLEARFQPGMTWENRGLWRVDGPQKWHIDHILPCAAFDLSDPEQQRKCFHYTNCRPIWAKENHEKVDKIEVDGKLIRAFRLKKA